MKLKVYNYKSQLGRYIDLQIDYPRKGIRKVYMIEGPKKNWTGEWDILPAIQYSHVNGIETSPIGPWNTMKFKWLKWVLLEISSWKEELSDEEYMMRKSGYLTGDKEYIDKDSTVDELTRGATWLDQENWTQDADH